MRILITGTTGHSMPPPYGGVPKLILNTARRWREWGNDVAITFTYKPANADDIGANAEYFFEYRREPNKLAKVFFLLKYFLLNPALYVALFRDYKKICPHISREMILYTAYGVYLDTVFEAFRPDIVLGEAVLVKSYMAAAIANRRNIPIVFDVYAEVRDMRMGENKYLSEDERKKYWISFLNMADLVIGLDNCAVEMKGYLTPEKLQIFWDTCDYEFFSRKLSESKESLREHFCIPKETFVVGAVGSFELRKGHDHLMQAVGRLVRDGYDISVVACGGGDPEKWRALAREHGIGDKVYLFQKLSEAELARLHRTMDVYTNLSNTQRSCSLDLSLLEAMSSARPVIVYDTGALPKAAANNNGIVVPMNEISGVQEAILKMYSFSPQEREAMGARSAEIAAGVDYNITTSTKLGWFKDIVEKRNIKQ